MNGLLNSSGGAVVIHTPNPYVLELFDHKVDDKLSAMIPDGRLYHQVYERSLFNDTHLVYRVKSSSKKRPFSTVDFKTYSRQSKGKKAVTHPEMAMMISDVCQQAESPGSAGDDDTIILDNDQEVRLRKDYGEEPFQESVTREAKAVTEGDPVGTLIDSCWRHLALCVCYFTKIEGGGSVYFGVAEEKGTSPMWMEAAQNVVVLTPSGREGDWKIWEDARQTRQTRNRVYYVAKESKHQKQKTGKFLTKPISLPQRDHEGFRRAILAKVNTDLKWVGKAKPQDPVQVHFHPVANAPQDKCVIEIKVNYYHGLCFYSKTGPESFKCGFQRPGTISPPPVEQIGFPDWIKHFKPDAAEILTEWKMQDSVS